MSGDMEDAIRDTIVRGEVEQAIEETSPAEEIQLLSQNYYLLKHRELEEFIDKYCPSMKPVFSHLNATSNIDTKTERLLRLYVRYVLDVAKLMWDKKDTSINKVIAHEALFMRSIFAISDAKYGWKGKLYTTRGRTVRVEGQEKKRGWFF